MSLPQYELPPGMRGLQTGETNLQKLAQNMWISLGMTPEDVLLVGEKDRIDGLNETVRRIDLAPGLSWPVILPK